MQVAFYVSIYGYGTVSAATSFQVRAVLYGNQGEEITSSSCMKLLGYTVDSNGGCGTHVVNIIKKMHSRSWALTRLKRYRFAMQDLISVYTTFIRPIAVYVSVVWSSMLTVDQSASLEMQQTRALRHILGFGLSARKMREITGIDLLSKRRENSCLKFANKCRMSDRFSGWFVERPPSGYHMRRRQTYEEPLSRTDRYRNLGTECNEKTTE